jgi:hypothetical protein
MERTGGRFFTMRRGRLARMRRMRGIERLLVWMARERVVERVARSSV